MSPAGRQRAATSAFAVGSFRRLWVAGVVSDAGDWLMFIALPLMVLRLTGSAFGTSIAFLLELLPAVVIAPVAGRVVDRLPHKPIMIIAVLVQAAAITPLLLVTDRGDLPIVYAVIVAQSVAAAFFEPAKNAMLPSLVGNDRLVSANALVGLNNDLGRLVGGPLGGVLFGFTGLFGVVLVDVISYFVAAALIASVSATRHVRATESVAENGSVDRADRAGTGLLAVLRRREIRDPLLVLTIASIAQGMFVVLFVFFVTEVLGGSDADVGLLRGIQAVGAMVAGVALGVRAPRGPIARLTVIGCASFALITVITWNLPILTEALPAYLILFAAIGAPAVLMSAGLTSQLQVGATDTDRGRVFALRGFGQGIGQGIGLVLAGTLQSRVGTQSLLETQAGCYLVAAALAAILFRRALRVRAVRGGGTRG